MEYVRLGRSGLKVSRVCLGTNMFGAGYVEDQRALGVIAEAHAQGLNFIDTADAYHSGRSEHVVGKGTKGRRQDFVIATKGFVPTGKGPNDRGLSRSHLVSAVEGSLRRLDTDYIDLYQVHYWDPETPLEETLQTLDDLVRAGKVRYVGCSNFAAWQLCRALWVSDKHGLERFESVQPEYNFRRRGIEQELFPLCLDQQVAVLPYQVLMAGLLTGGYSRNDEPAPDSHMASRHAQRAKATYWSDDNFRAAERVKTLSAEAGCHPAQLVVAWALAKPAVTSVIVGCSRPEHVVANAAVPGLKIASVLLEQLDDL